VASIREVPRQEKTVSDEWKPRFTSEEVTDGLPMWGAVSLGITLVLCCLSGGLLLGLTLLKLL